MYPPNVIDSSNCYLDFISGQPFRLGG